MFPLKPTWKEAAPKGFPGLRGARLLLDGDAVADFGHGEEFPGGVHGQADAAVGGGSWVCTKGGFSRHRA